MRTTSYIYTVRWFFKSVFGSEKNDKIGANWDVITHLSINIFNPIYSKWICWCHCYDTVKPLPSHFSEFRRILRPTYAKCGKKNVNRKCLSNFIVIKVFTSQALQSFCFHQYSLNQRVLTELLPTTNYELAYYFFPAKPNEQKRWTIKSH